MKMKFVIPAFLLMLIAYLAFWPVSVEPVAWSTPENQGFTGSFKSNQFLDHIEVTPLAGHEGPEAIVMDQQGSLYTATHDGWILKNEGDVWQEWVNTEGRPLGLAIDKDGSLVAADAFRGLLRITQDKQITLLTDSVNGSRIRYANDLDIASDGSVYFTDSSTKFSAKEHGGTFPASLLDLNEHGGHGRLLKYVPATGNTSLLLDQLNFANGVALDPQEDFLLVSETGSYRVLKFWLKGDKEGTSDVLIDNLPGFPDNISTGYNGRFWLGLPSPRSPILDKLSGSVALRKVIQRLPAFVRPKAIPYGHVVALDKDGKVLMSLQDPEGAYPITTGVLETSDKLYISSLVFGSVGHLDKSHIQSLIQN